jgi:cytochrome c-type protein NapB
VLLLFAACGEEPKTVPVPGHPGAEKSAAPVRAQRRAFDGAPPVIPHKPFGAACVNCHTMAGINVPGVGFAPPSPHKLTRGVAGTTYCTQCHVWKLSNDVWKENSFVGLAQDLRKGKSAMLGSPPVIPHAIQMRENCMACHTGAAAREEIRCDHPERVNCRQCHVSKYVTDLFSR